MKIRKLKVLVLGIIFILSIFAVIACGSKTNEPVLTMWFEKRFSDEYNNAMIDHIVSFGEEKGIKVNYEAIPVSDFMTKLNASLEAGNAPDVVEMSLNKILNYYPNIHFEDITDIVEQMHTERPFFDSVYNKNQRFDGKYYFAPMLGEVSIMYLRKDILEKNGITNVPTTWQELWDVARIVNDPENGIYGYGFGSGPVDGDGENVMRQIAWNYGASIFDESGEIVFDSDTMKNLLTNYVSLQKERVIPPSAVSWDGSGNNKSYLLGESAIIINAATLYGSLVNNAQNDELLDNTIFAEIPKGPVNDQKLGTISGMAITSKSQNKELAKELVLSFYDKEWYDEVLDLISPVFAPVFKDFEDNPKWQDDIGKSLSIRYISGASGYYGWPVTDTETRAVAARHYFTFPVARVINMMIIDDTPVDVAVGTIKKEIEDIRSTLK